MTASGCEDILVNAESDVLHLHSIRVTALAVLLSSTAKYKASIKPAGPLDPVAILQGKLDRPWTTSASTSRRPLPASATEK
jgi:hypothetical protein